MMAHIYNHSYSEGIVGGSLTEVSPGQKCEILSEKQLKQKNWGYSSNGRVAVQQEQGPEFKPYHCQIIISTNSNNNDNNSKVFIYVGK
jgi:hypothetical protein